MSRQHSSSSNLCLALCLGVAALPVLSVDWPPIFDYANHLARAHVMESLAHSPVFAAHFQRTSILIPNVLADLVVLGLMPIMGVLAAGKALLILTFALTVSGAYGLNRAITGRPSPWPLFTTLLLYNEGFFWGFLNYDLGLGLLLWGLAAWVSLRRRPVWQLAVGCAFAGLIFLAHLVAFGLYGLGIGVIELARCWRNRRLDAHVLVAGGQFLPPLAVFMGLSPSGALPLDAQFDFSIPGKIMPFARLLSSGNPGLDVAMLIALAGLIALALTARIIACHPTLLVLAGLYLALILVLPFSMLGSYFLDSRMVVALALILVASLTPRREVPWAAMLLLALVSARTLGLLADWRVQNGDYAHVIATLDQVPRGAVLVTAVGHPFELGDWLTTRHVRPSHEHTSLYATIRRDVLVPNIFARPGQNPLRLVSPADELNRLARNPVARVFNEGDARWLVEQVLPLADQSQAISPPIPAVYVMGYHVPCGWWPADRPIRPIHCAANYSLVEILGGIAEPIP